jgi:REP element-mobilizing transposase RayT
MARRLRIQFPGAMYHVINRGNFRQDLFETPGAAYAFENALGEACVSFGWQVHAFQLMRNHFHLALTTPAPNLTEGMHWLQTTYAIRFNRFRSESGHLFQGRYQSPLIEDAAALLRVVDYIHLNPVRAGIVPVTGAADYRWSSLARFVKGPRAAWLSSKLWLDRLQIDDSCAGWTNYLVHLATVPRDPDSEATSERALCRTWAIGTDAWRRALAREHQHRSLELDLPRDETRELKEERWIAVLEDELASLGFARSELARHPERSPWKVSVAAKLRRRAGAPYRWIAGILVMGSPLSVRVAVCRWVRGKRGQPGVSLLPVANCNM